MRTYRMVAAAAALAGGLAALSEPAPAQSLLQRLFGFGARSMPEDAYPRGEPYGPYSRPAYGYDNGWQEDYATYRTLCVRLCDGFYFPISDRVRRERLYQDSRSCMQRCDGEARLFYYPTEGGSVETMVDLAGRSYQSLPTAFKYRQALVAGCTCKPAPWSPEEAARHEGYAAEAAPSVANAGSAASTGSPADDESAGSSVDEPYYFEPPRPYALPPASYSRWRRNAWARQRYGWRD